MFHFTAKIFHISFGFNKIICIFAIITNLNLYEKRCFIHMEILRGGLQSNDLGKNLVVADTDESSRTFPDTADVLLRTGIIGKNR